ncbi:MAG: RecQ family zinc-binding domain-containing protein [Chitinispirillaceae bacterium]
MVNRISEMVNFFENKECLPYALARHFGETISAGGCGHCSVCTDSPVRMEPAARLSPLESYDMHSITRQITEAAPRSPPAVYRMISGGVGSLPGHSFKL